MKTSILLASAAAALGLFAAATAAADPLSTPALSRTLAANPNPMSVDAGPLGKIYVGGAFTTLGLAQNQAMPGDHKGRIDLSNAQVFVQKTDGLVQFYLQGGAYALPALGAIYLTSGDAIKQTYGAMPVGYVKLVPNSHFSVMAGNLPTLIGAESTFSFQNMNINRGLLWNQEPAVSRGVQANFSQGPLSLSLNWNDGFYSNHFNWVSGSATWTINGSNTLTFVAGANTGHTLKSTFATPYAQNNGRIYNLIYSYSRGPLTVTPYLQYTQVPASPVLAIPHSASTTGAAILAKYSVTPSFSLAGRAEYITSTGTLASGAPSLLYGPGSKAMSLTITPTWQVKSLFIRAELAYVKLSDATPGFALGPSFTATSQTRAAIETGFLF